MGEAYRIGISLGAGAGIGVVAAGLLARAPRFAIGAALVGAVVAALVGVVVFGVAEALAGAAGGVLGGAAAGTFVRGSLRRGGTAAGTALLLVGAGIVVFLLALIPVVGYLEAVALPALAVRARRRAGEKYAGLRTLAR